MSQNRGQSDGRPDVKRDEPILLSVGDVAYLLGLGERTVWRLSSAGELPGPISVGRSKRWWRQAIEDYVTAKARTADHGRKG